jgi:hypothetical protein
MSELTALLAAIVLGVIIAMSAVGMGVTQAADRIFNPTSAHADFSAKFIRP